MLINIQASILYLECTYRTQYNNLTVYYYPEHLHSNTLPMLSIFFSFNTLLFGVSFILTQLFVKMFHGTILLEMAVYLITNIRILVVIYYLNNLY